jgi:tetratricopeptide (TPR) repeat protein
VSVGVNATLAALAIHCGPGRARAEAVQTGPHGTEFALSVPTQAWAGEVCSIRASFRVPQALFYSLSSGLQWAPSALTLEPWPAPVKSVVTDHDGASVLMLDRHTRGLAAAAGTFDLGTATQGVTLTLGTSRFGNYVRPNLEEFVVRSAPARLWVQPLPPPPSDAGTFIGAVGQFTLTSKIVAEPAQVGRPITWTLTLSGTGNWPTVHQLPSPTLPPHFHALSPLRTLRLKAGTRFDGTLTEDLILMPEQSDRVSLGGVRWCYFDPQLGRYLTLSAPPVTLTVAPAAAARTAGDTAGWQLQGPDEPARRGVPAAPALPPPSLGDPITGTGAASAPWPAARVRAMAAWPAAALVPLWLVLAWWRMWRRDSDRPRREARRRALAALDALAGAARPEERQAWIERWQREAATLWHLRQATPVASAFGASAEWRQLWREAERSRFSADPALPENWITRARAATAKRRVPAPPPWRALRLSHLVPAAALLLVAFARAAAAAPAAVDDGLTRYRAGDFPGAEAAWRAAVARAPRDWAAHHNLALALAQQGRTAEAAAQAVAAFVQGPSDPVVRWDLAVTWGKARFGTPEIVAFIEGGPVARWARQANPAQWQRGLILGAGAIVLGLGGLLAARFLGGARPAVFVGGAVLTVGFLAAGSSAGALLAFGELAQPDAAIVWRETALRSVPTEVGGTQDAATLAPGTLVRLDESFLTWRHLTLANGQTGWIRRDTFVSLWQ